MHSNSFDDLIPYMKGAGFTATLCAAVITAMFGWQLGENVLASCSLATLLALCTFIVGYSLVAAYHAWKRGMRGVSAAAASLFAIAICVEFASHTSFNAANRDATVQQAAMMSTSYEDARGAVKDLEDKVQRLKDERNVMKPTQSVAAARAVIQASEAHRWFTGLTQGCKVTKGPQTRAFCDKYFSAQADVALWDQIAQQEIRLGEAEGELKAARAASGERSVGHAAGASSNAVFASLVTRTKAPDETALYWSGIGLSALIALFAIAAGGLLNFVAYAFEPVRRGAQAVADHAVDTARAVLEPTVVHVSDRDTLELLARLKRHLPAPAAAAAAA